MPTKKTEPSLQLMRHLLGSIDLPDIPEEKEQSEAERKAYCDAIFAVWPRLEKDIKKFLHAQLMFSNNNAATWDEVLISRGTFNGICLLEEHWQKAVLEKEGKIKENPLPSEPNNPMPEI